MLIQINSGRGPIECERACYLYHLELLKEYPQLEVVEYKETQKGCFQSVVFYSEEDLSFLEGSVQWICESPYRLHHKRKNWFIDVSVFKKDVQIIDDKSIRYEVFRSSGKGGQNVNKLSTAIRAIHIPTNTVVVCMDQRSQLQNKKLATIKLMKKLEEKNIMINHDIHYLNWNKHNLIVRGNPYRIYKGNTFKRIL